MLFSLLLFAAHAEETEDKEVAALRERVRLLEKAVDDLRGTSGGGLTDIPLDLETRINGYGAISLQRHEESPQLSFILDELVFKYTANLDRKLTFTTEFSLEAEEQAVNVGIETLEIGINVVPAFQVVAGGFHLPLSPWAVTASQGAYRYLPVEIPEGLVEEEGKEFLPIDQVGVQARGTIPVGFWQLGYAAGVTNGRSPYAGATSAWGDETDLKTVLGRIYVQSPGGLQVGAGVYYEPQMVVEAVGDIVEVQGSELIAGASIDWQGGPVDLRSEGYMTIHTVDGESHTSYTAFVVLGVPIKRTTPFVVVDFVSVDGADPLYAVHDPGGEPEVEFVAGLRYEVGLHLALKGQFDIAVDPTGNNPVGAGGQLQLAAGF